MAEPIDQMKISDILDKCTFHCYKLPDAPATVCAVVTPEGMVIATTHAACVKAEDYDQEIQEEIVKEKAWLLARDFLLRSLAYLALLGETA